MNRIILISSFAAATFTTAFVGTANAATVVTALMATPDVAYNGDILTNDLINVGSASLGSVVTSGSYGFDSDGVNDGVTHTSNNSNGVSYFNSGNVTFTFNLDVTTNTLGYDIQSITSIAGWVTNTYNHAAQDYEVLISTVGNAGYTALTLTGDVNGSGRAFVDDAASGSRATKITITDSSTGPIATGVDSIQFNLFVASGSSVIHEIDVAGQATTIPEPSTLALLGLGALLITRRRRRQEIGISPSR